MQLGPLTEQAMLKQFPDKWITLSEMLGLEFEVIGNSIHINIGELETISINKNDGFSTTFNIPDELLTKVITSEIARQQEKK